MHKRIHILGGSGTGTSTLARKLADHLHSQVFDADDFYWKPSTPPFQNKRPAGDRLALMQQVFAPRPDWILAGSISGWGDALIPRLTHVIFLTLPAPVRLARLRRRERERFGDEIGPGGALAETYRAFLEQAMSYDDPAVPGRSRVGHESWLAQLDCPVIRLDGGAPLDELTDAALTQLDRTLQEA